MQTNLSKTVSTMRDCETAEQAAAHLLRTFGPRTLRWTRDEVERVVRSAMVNVRDTRAEAARGIASPFFNDVDCLIESVRALLSDWRAQEYNKPVCQFFARRGI